MLLQGNYLKNIILSFAFLYIPTLFAQSVKKDTVFNRSYNSHTILSITTTIDDQMIVESFYYNGTLKSIKKLKSNKLDGEQKEWHENENLKSISNYVLGNIISIKEWYENGILKWNFNYYQYPSNYPLNKSNKLVHGEYKEYYKSGVPKISGFYDSGQRTGKWIEHYESGIKMSECDYKYNIQSGSHKQWYPNGKLKSENNYVLIKNPKLLKSKTENESLLEIESYKPYYSNSQSITQNQYWISKFHGKQANYSETGDIVSLSHYKMGLNHGVFKTWNSNKELLSWIEYDNGIVNGKNYIYYPNGSPHKLIHENPKYYNSISYNPSYDKSYKTFFYNGKPEVVGFYKNGKLHGEYLVYNFNGQIINKSNFIDGLKVGEQLGYNEKGVLTSKSFYKIIESNSGKISVLDGESISYYENGTLMSKENYINGNKHGICKSWYINGALMNELTYCNGLFCGVVFHYDQNGKVTSFEKWEIMNQEQVKIRSKSFVKGILINSKFYNANNKILKEINYYTSGNIKNVQYFYYLEKLKINNSYIYREIDFYENGKIHSDRFYFEDQHYREMSGYFNSNIGLELTYYKNGSPMLLKNHSYFDSTNFELFWDPAGHLVTNSKLSKQDEQNIYKTILSNTDANKFNFDTLNYEELNPFFNVKNTSYNTQYLRLNYHDNSTCIELINNQPGTNSKFSLLSNKGTKILEGEINNESKFGRWKYYKYPNTLRLELLYSGDTCFYKSYHSNKNLLESYARVKNLQEGEYINFHENGNKKTQAFYKMGAYDGIYKYWYPNGALEEQSQYSNGDLNGESIIYWENGNIKEKRHYVMGNKNHVWYFYDSAGIPYIQMGFIHGQQNQMSFYTNCFCENSDVKILEKINQWEELSNTDWFSNYYNVFSEYNNKSILGFSNLISSENKSNIKFNLQAKSRLFFKSQLNGFYINSCFTPLKNNISVPIEYQQIGNKDNLKINVDRLSYQCSKNLIEPLDLMDRKNNYLADGRYQRDKLYSEMAFNIKDITLFNDSLVINEPSGFCFTPSYITGTDIHFDLDTASVVSFKKNVVNTITDSTDQYQLMKNYANLNVYRYSSTHYAIESKKAHFKLPLDVFDTSFQKSNINVNGMSFMFDNNLILSMKLDVVTQDKNNYEVMINGNKIKFNVKDFSLNVYKKYKMRTSYTYIKQDSSLIIYLNKNNF